MTPLLNKFNKAYAKQLLNIAKGDLETAEGIAEIGKGRRENILFNVQQCVEKCIKAVICHMGQPVPMIHDIEGLLVSIPKKCPRPPDEEALSGLTQFATVRRYEEGFAELTDSDIKACLKVGQKVLKWAQAIAVNAKK